MDSEKLIFSLLGPPLITFRGKEIQVRRRKVRYLCYYLACQKFPVSRANLCDMFWPECNELEARKNLREALSNLRSSLSMGDYLLIHGDFISLNSEI
jgi:DNA-binding SARP family transcriptional activator